jgi:hypothetical protein
MNPSAQNEGKEKLGAVKENNDPSLAIGGRQPRSRQKKEARNPRLSISDLIVDQKFSAA